MSARTFIQLIRRYPKYFIMLWRVVSLIVKEAIMFHLSQGLVNLNHPAHYFKLGPIQISAGNLIVIVFMLVLFIVAMLLPFPGDNNE